MRIHTQASLASHIAVEVGDVITPPGMQAGRVLEISMTEILLGLAPEEPVARVRTVPEGCGIVMMDQCYLRPRPSGPVDHGT